MAYPVGPGDDDLEDGEFEEGPEAEEQLTLADEDERLPWLESDDEYEEEGFDGRLIIYAAIGLLVVGAILFAGWFFLRDRPDTELVADGSTIEAPDGPYKERPADPGGTEVAGTGDVSFEVGEGQTRRGVIAGDEDEPAPAPSIDRSQDSGEDGETSGGTTVPVQVGAFNSRADAERGWSSVATRFEAVSGMTHRIVQAEVDGATVYRLQVLAANRAAADATCRAIRASGGDCYVRP